MNIYTSEDMREFDRRSPDAGVPVAVLMENAGAGVAAHAAARLNSLSLSRALVLVGKGNNGGDALVAARELHRRGIPVRLALAFPPESFSPLAADVWRSLPPELPAGALHDCPESEATPEMLVVDGLLGTGLKGSPRGICLDWIKRLNKNRPAPVLAIDVPSGLDADTGDGQPLLADFTAVLAAPKTGMLTGLGPSACGRLHVIDIGLPPELLATRRPTATGVAVAFIRYKRKDIHA